MVYKSKERAIFLNVYDHILSELRCSVSSAVKKTAKMTGCSERLLYRLLEDRKKDKAIVTPRKPQSKIHRTRKFVYGGFVQSMIRNLIHQFFFQNIPPTLNLIVAAVKQNEDLPDFSRSSLHRYLHDIGFIYEKCGRKSILLERDDIIRWRHKYLREMKEMRAARRPIIFLGETWVTLRHSVTKAWADRSITSAMDAFLYGLSTGLKQSTGRGPRFVVIHAGNEEGFVPNAAWMFLCKKNTASAHDEMDEPAFEDWFRNTLIPNLKEGTVIVMDNAPYHSRKVEPLLASSWKKEKILTCLQEKGLIDLSHSYLKRELLFMVEQEKKNYDKLVCDELAKESGHTVVRLPPYHCELNPIELVWAQVKHYVAQNNTIQEKDMEKLINDGLLSVTMENWKNYIRKISVEEEKMWKADELMDDIEAFTVNTEEDTSSSEFSNED